MMVPGTESEIETELVGEDTDYLVPPDCMEEPTEEMTASPVDDETDAQDH